MGKIRNPVLFSEAFGIDPNLLATLGVLDPTLNVDTALFIDPMLLPLSSHPEMQAAGTHYNSHFEQIMDLLEVSREPGDVPWRSAQRLISYSEVKGTCLGFGANSISGSGFGKDLNGQLIRTAKEIIDIGVKNPKLFTSMMLFEDNVGPDRVSDLTTNVILPDLLRFNERVLSNLGIPVEQFSFAQNRGIKAQLPRNPTMNKATPVILVPLDILRDLPTAGDWDAVIEAAARNRELRERFNEHLAEIWQEKVRRNKEAVRDEIFSSPDAIKVFNDVVNAVEARPYHAGSDPHGLLFWHSHIRKIANEEPLSLPAPKTLSPEAVWKIVGMIVEQFRYLVEKKGIWKELWHDDGHRPEKAAQRLFFVVADSYCKANNLDITPEADSGRGPVDFKFSSGYNCRILVEIKLSTNSKLVSGFKKQLEAYKEAEETTLGYYVVIDVGSMGSKDEQLLEAKNQWSPLNGAVSAIEFINGSRQVSASKL